MDDLRSEYDLSQLKGGVRDKYYREAADATNLVIAETDDGLVALAGQVYEGLSENEIDEIERLALDRSSFFHDRPVS